MQKQWGIKRERKYLKLERVQKVCHCKAKAFLGYDGGRGWTTHKPFLSKAWNSCWFQVQLESVLRGPSLKGHINTRISYQGLNMDPSIWDNSINIKPEKFGGSAFFFSLFMQSIWHIQDFVALLVLFGVLFVNVGCCVGMACTEQWLEYVPFPKFWGWLVMAKFSRRERR